jgi:hypothetical protein
MRTMKRVITIRIPLPLLADAAEKLKAAGIPSATVQQTAPGLYPGHWYVKARASDFSWAAGQDENQLYMHVGWMLGVIGVPQHVYVEFWNEDEVVDV